MAFNSKKGYDPDLDYSAEIERYKKNGWDTSQLETQRTAKINDPEGKYKGIEPNMFGSNKTYTQASGDNDVNTINNAVSIRNNQPSGNPYSPLFNGNGAMTGGSPNVVYGNNQYGSLVPAFNLDSIGAKPTWDSQYQGSMDELMNKILNREDFSYNAQVDPLYQQYADMYGREGNRAMNDTLAAAASNAGGMNSYAITAAQQANNDYASKLGDKIPELYQLAYSMYLDGLNQDITNLGLLQKMDDAQYGRYRDTMSDWYNDRDFAYGRYRDDVGDSQWQQQFNYNANRDSIADQRYADELAYSRNQDAQSQLENKAALLASYGDFSGYKALGYTDAQIAIMQAAYQAQQTLKKSSGGGGGGGNGNGNGIGSDVYSWLSRSGAKDYGTAYQMLRNNGYSTTDANRYAKYFADTYMADTKPVVDESSKGYESVLTDVQALRKAGESSATINNVIVQAQKKGLITSAQAAQLRGSYVGSR